MGALQNLRPMGCTFHERILGAIAHFMSEFRGLLAHFMSESRLPGGRFPRFLQFKPRQDGDTGVLEGQFSAVDDSGVLGCALQRRMPRAQSRVLPSPFCPPFVSGGHYTKNPLQIASCIFNPQRPRRLPVLRRFQTHNEQDCQNCFLQEPIVTSWPQRAKERRRSFRTARAVASPSQLVGAFHTATSG